jgi:hypothetical protein
MISIRIIKSNRKEIWRDMPSEFREFTKVHLFAFTLIACAKFDDNKMHAKALLFRMLKLPIAVFFKLKVWQVNELLSRLQFLKEKDVVFENWLIPQLTIKWLWPFYIGPSGTLDNISTVQLANAESYLRLYHESKDVKNLYLLAATLYKPFNPLRWLGYYLGIFKTKQAPYVPGKEVLRSAFFSRVKIHKLEAIKMNFVGILNYYSEEFPNIPRTSSEGNNYGWAGLIFDLAGDKLGTIEQVEKQSSYNTLLFLDKMCSDAAKQKKN